MTPPKKPPEKDTDFSDSDRAKLESLLRDREFEDRLKARRKATWEAVKAWAQWLAAIALGWNIIRDAGSALWSHLKHFIGLPP